MTIIFDFAKCKDIKNLTQFTMKYQNLSPKKIANKFQQNFSALEGVFVFKVAEFCDKIGLNLKFVKLDKGKSGYFDLKLLIKLIIMLQECSQSRLIKI